jgi:membrane-associated phospholipid phosphatase
MIKPDISLVQRLAVAWDGLCLAAGDVRRFAKPHLIAQAARTRRFPLFWSLVYVVLFCALAMLIIDRPLALLLKAHVGGDIEGFFKIVTHLGEAQLYLIPSGIAFVGMLAASMRAVTPEAAELWRRLSVAPGFMFLTMAISGLISNAIKFGLGRLRPRYLFEQGLYGFEPFNTAWGMNSFPSGHSQAGFAAMTALMVIFPRYDLLWLLIATLVALSRVVITVHFLSDAVFGSFLAIAMTVLLARLFKARGLDPQWRLPRDWK